MIFTVVECLIRKKVKKNANNTLKPKVVIAKFNYAELAKWIDNHREVPESAKCSE
jgi:hypothetical protein